MMACTMLVVAMLWLGALGGVEDSGGLDFARDVRPILSDKCFQCHGPDEDTRQSGLRLDLRDHALAGGRSGFPAIVPGDREESEVWAMVSAEFAGERMPPKEAAKQLTAEEVEILGRWIDEGAVWAEHWSFVAPTRPAAPAVEDGGWSLGAVDRFLWRGMEARGFWPEEAAARETILRRVSFDLTGLPPTLDELDAFLADESVDALDRVIDRLFESPRYGEHMARYWLDAARYGDTHGLHLDNLRTMWLYRDWVIRAFDEKKRFDVFTIEQLAGDLLREPTTDQLIATGFNRCNVTTAEGGLIAEEYLAKYAWDRLDTTSAVWMGLTMGCAKCHDHKFDPVSQREYYQLTAFFRGLAEEASDGNAIVAAPTIRAGTQEQVAREAVFAVELGEIDAQLAGPLPEVDAQQAAWESERREALASSWQTLRPTSMSSSGGATMEWAEDGSVTVSGANAAKDVYEVVAEVGLEEIRRLHLEVMPPVGGGSAGRATNGNIVLTEIEVEVQPKTGGDAWVAAPIRWIETEHSQTSWPVAAAIDGDPKTGWALLPRQAEHHEAICVLESPVRIAGGARVRVRMKHESIHGQHGVSRFRISCSGGSGYPALDVGPWHRSKVFPAASAREALDAQPIDPAALELAALDEAGVPIWTEVGFTDGVIQQYEQIIGSIYLTRVIEAPAAGSIDISLGSDDSIYLWLNAEQVLAREIARSVAVDQELETLELKPGRNVILMKIVNQGGGFASYYQGEDDAMEAESALLVRTLTQVSASRSEEERASLREHYRRTASPQWREASERREEVATARDALVASYAQTMIMEERPEPRLAHLLIRGQYDQKGEELTAAVPSVFPPLPEGAAADRLGLARWLVDPSHPLTARVTVNRLWQQLFGTGIVKTSEDFGSQGEWPSHPELLDWLAVEFVESGWDIQHMQRLMLKSAAYAQRAIVSPRKHAADPENRLLARGASHRLDAEAIRDGALYISGLLVEEFGGPSVKPYQPQGVWFAVGYSGSNTVRFQQDEGEKLYRRSLYTFWKRTAPPPALSTFDAPSREEVCVRRERTNTPLQALVLLNDVQYVEAARVWAERLLSVDASDSERLARAFRMATSREPEAAEVDILAQLLNAQRVVFAGDADAAAALVDAGDSMTDAAIAPAELAAWTAVASAILNLHETITRG